MKIIFVINWGRRDTKVYEKFLWLGTSRVKFAFIQKNININVNSLITICKLSWLLRETSLLNSGSPEGGKDQTHVSQSAVRDVFGESDDEEEAAEYAVHNDIDQDSIVSIRSWCNVLNFFYLVMMESVFLI